MKWQPPNKSDHRMNVVLESDYYFYDYKPNGDVLFWNQHEHACQEYEQRITYLENILREYEMMLRGD